MLVSFDRLRMTGGRRIRLREKLKFFLKEAGASHTKL